MFRKILRRRLPITEALFEGHYIHLKMYYVARFNRLPCISFVGEIDLTQAFAYISEQYRTEIVSVYQHAYFDHEAQSVLFNNTVFVLRHRRMIELAGHYCQIAHTESHFAWANQLMSALKEFRVMPVRDEAPAKVIGFARQENLN